MNKEIISNYMLSEQAYFLVWLDGVWQENLSNIPSLPNAAVFCSLSHAKNNYRELINEQKLNSSEGYFLYLPENTELKFPIHLLFLATKDSLEPNYFSNLIISKTNHNVTLIEEFASTKTSNKYANYLNTKIVAKNLHNLQYVKLQNESLNATHIANIDITQYEQSKIHLKTLWLGGFETLEKIEHNFLNTSAAFDADGLYFLKNKQKFNFNLHVAHLAKSCSSNILYKGIINDAAEGNFTGKILVTENSKESNAHLTNKNLLLSDAASIQTAPELEIYTDDVKCSHGAAIGQLDEQTLFYLQSRGIDKETAKGLLLKGFAQEILDKFPKFLTEKIANYYYEKLKI